MTNPESNQHIQRAEGVSQPKAHAQPQIDIQVLAEKVYQLMLADVRLEQARSTRAAPKRKRAL